MAELTIEQAITRALWDLRAARHRAELDPDTAADVEPYARALDRLLDDRAAYHQLTT